MIINHDDDDDDDDHHHPHLVHLDMRWRGETRIQGIFLLLKGFY